MDYRSKSMSPTDQRLVALERARQARLKEPKNSVLSRFVRPQRPQTCSRGMPHFSHEMEIEILLSFFQY